MADIIVPVDFSDTAAAALRFGTYLAELMDLDLRVVHFFDAMLSSSQSISHRARERERERLRELLKAFVRRQVNPVLATFQGRLDILPAVKLHVAEGVAAQELRWLSSAKTTELIVMGGTGSGSQDHPPGLFGGVARTVALKGAAPVILIPKDYGFPTVETIAVAFAQPADLRPMSAILRRIITALRASVRYVHVSSGDEEAEVRLEESFLERSWQPDFPSHTYRLDRLPPGNVTQQLLDYTEREQVGLLALGGQRRDFFQRLFRSNHLGAVVRRSHVPLLIIPFSAEGG